MGPLLAFALALASPPAAPSLRLLVDASEAPRRIVHAREALPARPGPLTLVYPKWIPGEHSPSGVIANVVGLRFSAGGRPVPWRRDAEDMYAFHLEVPGGVSELEAAFDFLLGESTSGFSAGASASAELTVINWHQVVLYPQGARARDVRVSAALLAPAAWRVATALPTARAEGARTEFAPVSLETLIDSPVLTGARLRTVDLAAAPIAHRLNLAADGAAALEPPDEVLRAYKRLVAETGALFGARPYAHYDFLLSLSDHVAHFGLEHHQSSDNRQAERTLVDPGLRLVGAGLLPHEFVHAWNGKYRRPADLATPDYQQPMHTALLWVYEGLTQYLGDVLTARSGLRTAAQAREALALTAATLDVAPGRTWRPLGDTALAAQTLYLAPREWRSWRRGVDFYPESELIWLEADAILRAASGGRRSLDDFCRAFHGGASGGPSVKTYTREDVVAALNAVAAHDWRGFFAARVDAPTTRAPLGGIEAAGWRLAYQETPSEFVRQREQSDRVVDLSFSLGLLLRDDGVVVDAIQGAPAARAGVGPGMRVIAVGGRRFSPQLVRDAVRATRTTPDVELLMENDDHFRSHRVAYRGGARYPVLERDASKPDLLSAIMAPRAP